MSTNVRTETEALIAAIAAAIKADRAAIAALEKAIDDLELTGGGISETDVKALIKAAIDDLVDGAPEALDTLKEIADMLEGQDTAISGLLAAISNRVSYADPQILTALQMTQAQTNIGLGDWAGATSTLSQIFNAALA